MRFRRDRADCGDRGLRAVRSALSRSRDRGQDHSAFLLSRSSPVPPRMSRRNDRCRAVSHGRYPAGAPVILFKAIQRKVERRNASKTQARPEPPATCTLPLPGTCMPVRRSLTLSAVSVSRSRLAGPARREQLERRDPRLTPATRRGRGRGRCAVPPDHTPAGPPGPARAAIGPASARVDGSRRTLMCGGPRSDLNRTGGFARCRACDCPVPSVFALSSVLQVY